MPHDADRDSDMNDAAAAESAGELLLVGEQFSAQLIAESLEADDHRCACAESVEAGKRHVLETRFDVILLDLDALAGRAFEIVQLAARLSPATLCILRSRVASVESVVAAMRAGVGDYLVGTLSVPQLRVRVRAAIRRAREARTRLERVARLTSICRSLVARRGDGPADVEELAALIADPTEQPGVAVDDAARRAPREHDASNDEATVDHHDTDADDAPISAIAFDAMARQHLDAEQLVTASIEHLVGELGAMNVAIYLGTGSCRFGLAAYARADLPRLSIEATLLRWSEGVCTEAAADGRVQIHPDASALFQASATDATEADTIQADGAQNARPDQARPDGASAGRVAVIVPCKHDGVCDAVFILLLSPGLPLRSSAPRELEAFGRTFARQLQFIQRIHTRYRPSWPAEPD